MLFPNLVLLLPDQLSENLTQMSTQVSVQQLAPAFQDKITWNLHSRFDWLEPSYSSIRDSS
jgi:hypothetical protein